MVFILISLIVTIFLIVIPNLLPCQDVPDGGFLRVGDTVAPLFVDQSRESLDPEKTVYEEITEGSEEVDVGEYHASI